MPTGASRGGKTAQARCLKRQLSFFNSGPGCQAPSVSGGLLRRLLSQDSGIVLSRARRSLRGQRGGCRHHGLRRCDASSLPARYRSPRRSLRGRHSHRPGRTTRSAERISQSGRRYAGGAGPHSNSVPSTRMQCRMTASLRATATRAFFMPTRLANRIPHAFSRDHRSILPVKTEAASNR